MAPVCPRRLSAATLWIRSSIVSRTSGGSTLPPNSVISHEVIEPSSSDSRSPERVDSTPDELPATENPATCRYDDPCGYERMSSTSSATSTPSNEVMMPRRRSVGSAAALGFLGSSLYVDPAIAACSVSQTAMKANTPKDTPAILRIARFMVDPRGKSGPAAPRWRSWPAATNRRMRRTEG